MTEKDKVPRDKENIPEVEREGWEAEKLVEEATNEESDDIVNKIKYGGETPLGVPQKKDVPEEKEDFDNLDKRT